MKSQTLIRQIATLIAQRQNCIAAGNQTWLNVATDRLNAIAENRLPSGSGIDAGTAIDLDASTPEKIVFTTEFHHMNENGFYDGWTAHRITVRPAFDGIAVAVSGRNRNDIKEYLADVFSGCLQEPAAQFATPAI